MRKIAKWIVRHDRALLILFLVMAVVCGICASRVETNYSLTDYLPKGAASSKALKVMEQEFHEPIPNLRVAIEHIDLPQAMAQKAKLEALPEVRRVSALDTFTNIYQPLALIDQDLKDQYFVLDEGSETRGTALFELTVKTANAAQSLDQIKGILGTDVHYEGDLVSQSFSQKATSSEVFMITAVMLPLGVLILLVATRSFLDPILLLLTIGVAIILNMGTNLPFGKVSFITMAVSSILQLAVSMDYVIFLLHAWSRHLDQGMDRDGALVEAIVESAASIVSSALTTIFGFLALVFMRYRLGLDLGFVLAKGVAFSLICVIFFLPPLLKLFGRWEERWTHRSLLPSFQGLSRGVQRFRFILLLLLVLLPVTFLAQKANHFTYGMGQYPSKSVQRADQKWMEQVFGVNNQIVLLLPQSDLGKEMVLLDEIKQLPEVRSVFSYSELIGPGLPQDVVPEEEAAQLVSQNYRRVVLNTAVPTEGEETFKLVEEIRQKTSAHYGNQAHILGYSASLKDMKEIIQQDNKLVNLLAICSIALVIGWTFRSLLLPFLLVLTIELSIWINLSFPYFTDTKLSFIGYLIISSIQLGATVDYAILYTNHYLEERKKKDRSAAMVEAGAHTYGSIIPPAFILALAGFLLAKFSSLEVVSEIGTVLGRGAVLSLLMVVFLLPVLLYFCDGAVEKTTKGCHFYHTAKDQQADEVKGKEQR